MRPPTRLAPSTRAPLPVGRRGGQAARRSVLVQCDRCGVHGTGTADRRRVRAVDLPARRERGGAWLHAGCGGRLLGYDIEAQ